MKILLHVISYAGPGGLDRKGVLRAGLLWCGVPWLILLSVLNFRAAPIPQVQLTDAARAEQAMREGKFDLAAEEYAKLVKVHPLSAELWSNLGSVQVSQGNCQQAMRSLDKAKSLNSALFAPWYFSSLCHLQLHQDEQAESDAKRALHLNSRDSNAWYLLAQAAGNLEQISMAFNAMIRALSLDPKRPEGYYQAGKMALDLAAACYGRVQAAPGPSPFAARLEGERDAGQGALELALGSYRSALELVPGDPDVHFALGSLYLETGKLPEAEAELRRCIGLFPASAVVKQTAWARLRLAVILARENKADEAKQIVDSLKPRQFEAREEFEDALHCAFLLNQPTLAGQILSVALERFPGDPALMDLESHLAHISSASGPDEIMASTPDKIGAAVRFTALANQSAGNFVANSFGSSRDYHQFRESFLRDDVLGVAQLISTKIERLPTDPARAFVLGEVLHWLSFGLYERLETGFPDSEAAQMLMAENFAAAGQGEKAIEIYQGLLEKGRSSPYLLRALARVYWTQGRWDEALTVFRSLLEVDPYDSTTLVNVGRIYSYRQDLENAEDNFRRAAHLDPKMAEAHLGLGDILRRKGDVNSALNEFKIASQLDPTNPRPHYALSQVYRKLDQKQLAEVEMQTFQRLQAQATSKKAQGPERFVPVE